MKHMKIFGNGFEDIDLPSFCKGVGTIGCDYDGEYKVKEIVGVFLTGDTMLVHARLKNDDPNLVKNKEVLLEKPLSPSSIDRAAPVLIEESPEPVF